jgi:hypothetical protein
MDAGCHVVSVTDPYDRILDSLDRSRYFFFQVAPQFYSLLFRKFGSAGNRTRASGSVDRKADRFGRSAGIVRSRTQATEFNF